MDRKSSTKENKNATKKIMNAAPQSDCMMLKIFSSLSGCLGNPVRKD